MAVIWEDSNTHFYICQVYYIDTSIQLVNFVPEEYKITTASGGKI